MATDEPVRQPLTTIGSRPSSDIKLILTLNSVAWALEVKAIARAADREGVVARGFLNHGEAFPWARSIGRKRVTRI
jgi:hypothetical protein